MNYDVTKLTSVFYRLNDPNYIDVCKVGAASINYLPNRLDDYLIKSNNLTAVESALKATTQCLAPYEKLIQESSAMQTALKTLSDTFQSSSYKDLVTASGISTLLDKDSGSLDIALLGKTTLETLNNSSSFSEEDFITFNETPIKEWNIPDSVAIPVGNNRVRIKTDLFIAILSGIFVPIFLWFAGQIVDLNDVHAKAQTESQRLEIEQERNDLLRENNQLFNQYIDLLMSADTSNSSEAEQIEHLKESLPKPDSAPIASDLTPDDSQESHNSNPE